MASLQIPDAEHGRRPQLTIGRLLSLGEPTPIYPGRTAEIEIFVRGSPEQCSEAALALRRAIVSADLQIVKPARREIRRVGSEAFLGRDTCVGVAP